MMIMRPFLLLLLLPSLFFAFDLDQWLKTDFRPKIPRESASNVIGSSPIIGIITQPSDESVHPGPQHITAAYVKWIEMAGGRAAIIPYDAPVAERRRLFNAVNGILIQGGATDLITSFTPYYRSIRQIFQWVIEAHEKGDDIPMWGTCLGFEQLCILASHDNFPLLGNFDAENITLPLYFTPAAFKSRLFGSASSHILDIFASQPVTDNFHHNGVHPDMFKFYPYLGQFFEVLSVNVDRKGVPFVSTVEAKNGLPIWAIQWHPERAMFEHIRYNEEGNMSFDSMVANQYMGNFFIEQCRRSKHRFPTYEEERASLIYSKCPVWLDESELVTQSYFFPDWPKD